MMKNCIWLERKIQAFFVSKIVKIQGGNPREFGNLKANFAPKDNNFYSKSFTNS